MLCKVRVVSQSQWRTLPLRSPPMMKLVGDMSSRALAPGKDIWGIVAKIRGHRTHTGRDKKARLLDMLPPPVGLLLAYHVSPHCAPRPLGIERAGALLLQFELALSFKFFSDI